ncbi:hypothetical protein ADUPG1_013390 [Aduncisulcus paluster]|uniref:Uncharacterized protein n=1 Tax=Aduncisulcus paluster TaxID=2918883 RepID=A0ABQ5K2S1_9EUKA|nr:hypothetical protein ADUPG1_013390 [Aduncisulcus paluster]
MSSEHSPVISSQSDSQSSSFTLEGLRRTFLQENKKLEEMLGQFSSGIQSALDSMMADISSTRQDFVSSALEISQRCEDLEAEKNQLHSDIDHIKAATAQFSSAMHVE